MKNLLVFVFALIAAAGCDGVGVGDKRALLLSPNERQLVQDFRAGKIAAVPSDSVLKARSIGPDGKKSPELAQAERSKALVRPMSPVELPADRDEKEWQFRWSWDRGVTTPGKPSEDNPEYDADGNLIVPLDVVRAYKIPDLSTGVSMDFNGKNKIRSVLEMELAEFRVPKLGWFSTGILAGEQFAAVHLSKQIIPVFEIESGLYVGKDFDTDETVYGLSLLIIKF